jgi:hypothetical protein
MKGEIRQVEIKCPKCGCVFNPGNYAFLELMFCIHSFMECYLVYLYIEKLFSPGRGWD